LFSIYSVFSKTAVARSVTSASSGLFGASSKTAPAPFFEELLLA